MTLPGWFTIADGFYTEQIVPNSASVLTVRVGKQYGLGDLDGDGDTDAAAVLIAQSDSSGTFYKPAAVVDEKGTPFHRGSAFLGDCIVIESVSVDAGRITVEIIVQGRTIP